MVEDDNAQSEDSGAIDKDFFEVVMAQKDCAPAMKPKSFHMGMIASSVAKPSNATQAKNVLKSNRCVIRGSASTFTASTLPHENETILSTANLDSVKIKGRRAEVGGGTPFYKLIDEAKKNNLEVPCYPQTYIYSTIGGFIANNGLVGFNSRGTGYLKDYIEELDIITPSGARYKVRGNDVNDFFGSEGTLGLILNVKLRLLQKQSRYIHMFGFDGIEDVLRFAEEEEDIYALYLINAEGMRIFQDELQLKYIPEYTAIVIDKNWRDDYKKELRTDLAQKGISYIYPKEVLKYCFKRVGKLELGIVGRRDDVHIGDGIVSLDDCYKVIRMANSRRLPLFMNVGQDEILYRVYADCRGSIRRTSFMLLMDDLHSVSEPNSVGSFFRADLEGTPRKQRIDEAKGKYDSKISIIPRMQLYPKKGMRKVLSPIIRPLAGRLW